VGKCLGWREESEKEEIDREKGLGGPEGRAEKKLDPLFKKGKREKQVVDCAGGGRMP
jgi:hypothetical protein